MIETVLQGKSSRGKPVILRKYIRGWHGEDLAEGPGQVTAAVQTGVAAAVHPWYAGIGPSSYVVIGVSGRQAASPPTVNGFLGNRQKPRGKKRKAALASPAAVAAAYDALSVGGKLEVTADLAKSNLLP